MKTNQPLSMIENERGSALITILALCLFLAALSGAAFSRAYGEMHAVERETARVQSFAAAEAALQNAMAQIGVNAYTGYINTAAIDNYYFQSTNGTTVGSFNVTMDYPNSADWITIHASATANGETQQLEGRVFLNSNLSKYLIYSDTSVLSLGNNLTFGENDGANPEGVAANEDDRPATYHTNDLDFAGTNIHVYGDVHAERLIDGSTDSYVHGDTYAGNFAQAPNGTVTDDGVNGNLVVGDGFSDDTDRNHDGTVNATDFPDRHDLTDSGEGDAHQTEVLDTINTAFYKANKDSALPAAWAGSSAVSRYIEMVPSADGSKTKIIEYSNATYATQVGSYTLSSTNAIVYVNGNMYIKGGTIVGRVSFVSSDDILFDGNVKYKDAASYCSPANSAAFMAKDKVYLRPKSLEISGIVYADRAITTSSSTALDANYNTSGVSDPGAKYDGHFRLYGNVILDGTGNTSVYTLDRAYVYDRNLKYYRPPGIPVRPELKTVVEE